MIGVLFFICCLICSTAYFSVSAHDAYIKAKEFQKVQAKAKKPEQSQVNIWA